MSKVTSLWMDNLKGPFNTFVIERLNWATSKWIWTLWEFDCTLGVMRRDGSRSLKSKFASQHGSGINTDEVSIELSWLVKGPPWSFGGLKFKDKEIACVHIGNHYGQYLPQHDFLPQDDLFILPFFSESEAPSAFSWFNDYDGWFQL